MKKEDLILIGGGGHCKSCIDVIEQEGKYHIAGIIDIKENVGNKVLGYTVIGCDDDLNRILKEYNNFFITVGQIDTSYTRRKLYQLLNDENIVFPIIKSPSAYISKYSKLGKGSILMHNSVVNAESQIGSFNIINTNAVIEHDSIIGDFNHISVSSTVCGSVNIGNDCFLGSNSTVRNNININNSIIVGANSFVNRSLLKPGRYLGSPIRSLDA